MGIYIELAISLMLVFLTLSLVVTAASELIAIQLKKRPRMLLQTISVLIDNPELRAHFYSNGFVVSTKRASAGEQVPIDETNHPSYIAAENFSKGLVMAALARARDPQQPLSPFTFADVDKAVQALPGSRIKDILVASLSRADGSLDRFEQSLSRWYDTTMDRLSGEYARHQKLIGLAIAAVIVVGLNVDVVRLSGHLIRDDALRQQLTAQATALAGRELPACQPGGGQSEPCWQNMLQDSYTKLAKLPLGWTDDDLLSAASFEAGIIGGMGKLLGWGIAILSVSLGAPFWFDLLQKFVNIRGAGVKPTKTPEPA